ncbi:MAG: hypothetical protein BWK79_16545 [Beggiatoa sp. IS2]|nr:MAG: hypothetical protein BWK79_16545 [Beggiatoa sp. IS2]
MRIKIFPFVLIALLISYIHLPLSVSAENKPVATPETPTAPGTTPLPNQSPVVTPSTEKQPPVAVPSDGKVESVPSSDGPVTDSPEEDAAEAEDETAEDGEETDETVVNLTMHHRINDEKPLDETQVEPDLLVLLQTFKTEMIAQLAKHAYPLQIETIVQPLLAEDLTATVGMLPSLIIKTQFDSSGSGQSHFTLPATQRKIPTTEKYGKITVDWKGLQGQLNFTDKLKSLTTSIDIAGLLLEEEKGFDLSLGKTTLGAEFDADLIPIKMNLVLPSLKISHDQIHLSVQNAIFDAKIEKRTQGVDLSNVKLKVNQASFGEDKNQATLTNFELTGHGEVQEKGVFYGIRTTLDKLLLPKGTAFDDEDLEINYSGNIELRHLDVATTVELQKTARELQKQRQSSTISEEMMNFAMLGKLMEVAPKLLAKSPEISMTQMNVKTNHGELQGKLTMSVNGETPISFEESSGFLAALRAQAEFSIHKGLMEKIFNKQLYQQLLKKQPGDKKPTATELADLEKQASTMTKQRLQNYIQQKLLLDTGGNVYKIIAQLQDGKLTVNGQEVPLPF